MHERVKFLRTASGTKFFLTYTNIVMINCERAIKKLKPSVCVIHIDDIFFTWLGSEEFKFSILDYEK